MVDSDEDLVTGGGRVRLLAAAGHRDDVAVLVVQAPLPVRRPGAR